MLVNKHEAEEIVQEALLRLFIKFQQTETPDDKVNFGDEHKALLYVTAHNLAISRIRHKKVRQRFIDDCKTTFSENSTTVERNVQAERIRTNLLNAINQLPPMCRQVFVQRRLNCQSNKEISKHLGISIKTVENHLTKGLKLCRKHLMDSTSRNAIDNSSLSIEKEG